MRLSQVLKKRYPLSVLAALLVVIIGIAVFITYRALYPSTPVLRVEYVSKAPKLDGNLNDSVWQEAESVTVNIKDGPEVTMKAVYTEDRVFIQASYPGDKRGGTMYQWRFDGEKWSRGPANDMFGFFVNNSVKDFNEKGFGVMEQPLPFDQNDPNIGASGTPRKGDIRSKRAALQSYPYILLEEPTTDDLRQRGELWEMTMGLSNQFGKCMVYTFKPYPPLTFVPTGIKSRLAIEFTRVDSENKNNPYFINRVGVTKNENSFRGNMPMIPVYKYKPGLNVTNTPYPRLDDMRQIPDMTEFKKGDSLPFVVFDDKDWDGEGFNVDGKAVFNDGVWTVEISRPLDTKQRDNIVFRPKKDGPVRYHCAILLHAYQMNLTATKVNPGPVMIMELEPKISE